MHPRLKAWVGICAIIIFVGLLYGRLPGTYFCGYDDFNENDRAAFEETKEPLRILTATHFNSYKYRPLSHALHFMTYRLGHGDALLFRVRNVACHLINVLLVFGIGILVFNDRLISGSAALLFGVHPLVNQPIVATSFTIPAAHVFFLSALFCFLYSVSKKPGNLFWLCLALVLGWLGLLTYESSITVFGLMFAYIVIRFAVAREKIVSRKFLLVLTIGTFLLVGSYFGMRRLFVTVGAKQAIPSVKTIAISTTMYAGALLLPVDSVLANEWFGLPLPSELKFATPGKMGWLLLLGTALVAAALFILLLYKLAKRLRKSELANLAFLALAIIFSLAPLIVFTPKPSETYLYLAAAFGALIFTFLLRILLIDNSRPAGKPIFAVIVGVLAVLFSCATWVRNERVVACGATAQRIMGQIQEDRLKQGPWDVWLAAAPGEPRSKLYGIYGCRGIDTIGEPGVQSALRLANFNELLTAKVISAESFTSACYEPRTVCLLVHDDGSVIDVGLQPILSR